MELRYNDFIVVIFFSIWVFFRKHWRTTGQQGKKEGPYLLPSTISTRSRKLTTFFPILLYIWEVYLLFSIAAHVINKLVLEEIYLSLEIRSWLNIYYIYFISWFYVRCYYSNSLQTSGKFELASTIIPPIR